MDLGIARRDLFTGPAGQLDRAAFDVSDGADAVPLEFESPVVVWSRDLRRELGHHRLDASGHGLAAWILWRIHAVDHPVLAVGPKQHVFPFEPLAVEDDHHLAVGPLLGLVRALIPNGDMPCAVDSLRDVAGKVD